MLFAVEQISKFSGDYLECFVLLRVDVHIGAKPSRLHHNAHFYGRAARSIGSFNELHYIAARQCDCLTRSRHNLSLGDTPSTYRRPGFQEGECRHDRDEQGDFKWQPPAVKQASLEITLAQKSRQNDERVPNDHAD